MKKSEFLSAAEREGDKLFIFKAMQYRWETDQMADPHTRDEKFFLAEKEAIEYAEGLDLELGYRPEVERITIIEDDLEEEFELVDLEDIHADIETVYVGDENKGRDLDGNEIVVSYSHHMFMNYAYEIQAIQFVRETSLKYESDLRNDRDQVYSTYFYLAKDLNELAMDFEEGRVVPFNKINRGSRIVREFLAENEHPNYVEEKEEQ